MRALRLDLSLAFLAVLGRASLAAPDVEATGLDAVTTPGTPVLLRAKFERRVLGPIQPDLARRRVVFSALGRELSDLTDPEGIAEASVTPVTSGVFTFRATLHDPPAVAEAELYVVERERPVAVVDIDGTLSDMSLWRALTSAANADTFPGAPELLRDLARTHQVVYLTARDDHFAGPTRAFLRRHGFPPGPVLLNTWGLLDPEARAQLSPGAHGEFKLRVLRLLQGRGLRLRLGIGDAETDAQAYTAAGLPGYIRTDRPPGGACFHFTDYEQLRARLAADGVLAGP